MKALIEDDLKEKADDFIKALSGLDKEKKIKWLNQIREDLYEVSPFSDPVDNVKWVKYDRVRANDYNPNKVAPPEMRLLKLSIKEDGFTQPVVCYYDKSEDEYEVVDGFHRHLIPKEYKMIHERMHGRLPIVVIDKPIKERMASTIRHNRARGQHSVGGMSDLVADLVKKGWEDEDIAKELGMDADEVLRLKQQSGLPEIFKEEDFSQSWE